MHIFYVMSCTANRRILHCTYYVKKTDLLHKNAQRSLKVSQSELSCHQGEKQVIIKFIFKRYTIYISHSLVSLTISVGYQMTLSINHHWKKKKRRSCFFFWRFPMQRTCPGTRNSSFRSLQLADSAGVKWNWGILKLLSLLRCLAIYKWYISGIYCPLGDYISPTTY